MNTHTQQFILTKSHICRPAAHNTHERTKCVINPQLKIVPKNTIKKRNYILFLKMYIFRRNKWAWRATDRGQKVESIDTWLVLAFSWDLLTKGKTPAVSFKLKKTSLILIGLLETSDRLSPGTHHLSFLHLLFIKPQPLWMCIHIYKCLDGVWFNCCKCTLHMKNTHHIQICLATGFLFSSPKYLCD